MVVNQRAEFVTLLADTTAVYDVAQIEGRRAVDRTHTHAPTSVTKLFFHFSACCLDISIYVWMDSRVQIQ